MIKCHLRQTAGISGEVPSWCDIFEFAPHKEEMSDGQVLSSLQKRNDVRQQRQPFDAAYAAYLGAEHAAGPRGEGWDGVPHVCVHPLFAQRKGAARAVISVPKKLLRTETCSGQFCLPFMVKMLEAVRNG